MTEQEMLEIYPINRGQYGSLDEMAAYVMAKELAHYWESQLPETGPCIIKDDVKNAVFIVQRWAEQLTLAIEGFQL